MSLFVVDPQKCGREGMCVAVCPLGIIKLKGQNSVPVPSDKAEDLCVNCGHCVAVCPGGALTHKNMRPEQCFPIQKERVIKPEQIRHFLCARRSIRVYKEQPVKRELLAGLIDIARFAPSGHNRQPVKWLVIYNSDEVQRLAGLVADWMRFMLKEEPKMSKEMHMDHVIGKWEAGSDIICRNAPHLIIAHAPATERTAPAACTIAMTYLELAAVSFGLGTCWAGFFNAAATLWPPLQQSLGLPDGHVGFGAMMVGYPKFQYHRIPLRNEPQITWHI